MFLTIEPSLQPPFHFKSWGYNPKEWCCPLGQVFPAQLRQPWRLVTDKFTGQLDLDSLALRSSSQVTIKTDHHTGLWTSIWAHPEDYFTISISTIHSFVKVILTSLPSGKCNSSETFSFTLCRICSFFHFLFFETGSQDVAQAGLKFFLFLPRLPKCWDCECESSGLPQLVNSSNLRF